MKFRAVFVVTFFYVVSAFRLLLKSPKKHVAISSLSSVQKPLSSEEIRRIAAENGVKIEAKKENPLQALIESSSRRKTNGIFFKSSETGSIEVSAQLLRSLALKDVMGNERLVGQVIGMTGKSVVIFLRYIGWRYYLTFTIC